MYNDPNCSPMSSTKWLPKGYTSRNQTSADNDADDEDTLVDGHTSDKKNKNKMSRKNSPQADVEMRENA